MSDRPTKAAKTQTDRTGTSSDGSLPDKPTAGDPVQQFLKQVARTPPPQAQGGRGRL